MDKFSDLVNLLRDAAYALKIQVINTDTTTTGDTIDIQGDNTAFFLPMAGTLTLGDFEFQLFHGDESDMSDEAQVASTDYNGTIPDWDDHTADDDKISPVQYVGIKRYLRFKVVTTNSADGTVGVIHLPSNVLHGPKGQTQAP
jgi:hypothetical protein